MLSSLYETNICEACGEVYLEEDTCDDAADEEI